MSTRLRPSQPTLPILLVVSFALIYVTAVLINAGGDPLAFVNYDGHFAYQIAIRPTAAAPFLDVPAYRYQRIFYPLVSYVFSLGQASLAPWMLIGVNIIAIGLGTWAMARLLTILGTSPWYALIYGLYGGNFVALRTNLTEPLAYGLVALAILAWEEEHLWWSVVGFSLAALTKEVTLVFVAAYMGYALLRKDWRGALALGLAGNAGNWFWRCWGDPIQSDSIWRLAVYCQHQPHRLSLGLFDGCAHISNSDNRWNRPEPAADSQRTPPSFRLQFTVKQPGHFILSEFLFSGGRSDGAVNRRRDDEFATVWRLNQVRTSTQLQLFMDI
jgi:hypothetical protein